MVELGGNAPFLVLDDADLDVAVYGLVACMFNVSGQVCVCANGIYVQECIHDQFIEKLVIDMQDFKVGPAADASTTPGPLTNVTAVVKSKSHADDAVPNSGKGIVGGATASDLDQWTCA